jgi:indolepyruvate ferredoxin oxidoreductase beta subunit
VNDAATTRRRAVLLVGVGGQGVLTAAKVLGDACHRAGLPVVVGQLHGMSQRGGSVECSVQVGRGSSSFLLGPADVVVAFEPLEARRALGRVGPDTTVLVSPGTIVPHGVTRSGQGYPDLDDTLREIEARGGEVIVVDGPGLARLAGDERTLNVLMLGALAGLAALPLGPDALFDAVADRCPPRTISANRRAFELGLTSIRERRHAHG